MTQELIDNMLGVRREGGTEAASKLKQAKLIRCARGKITVRDRKALEVRTCDCFAVRDEHDRLLQGLQPAQQIEVAAAMAISRSGRPPRQALRESALDRQDDRARPPTMPA